MGKSNNSRFVVKSYHEPIPKPFTSELKYVDTTIGANSAVSNTGSWTKLSFPAQGTTSITRVADRIRGVSIEWRGYLNCTSDDTVRFIVLQTKGIFTSAPAVTDVLSSVSPFAPYAYNARNLYNIIHDNIFALSSEGDSRQTVLTKDVKLRETALYFVPGSTNVYSGQIYFLFLSVGTTVTNGHIIRFWFEDSN